MLGKCFGISLCLLAMAGAVTGQSCTVSPTAVCLLNDRFQVEVVWSDEADNPFTLQSWGSSGVGMVELQHPQLDPHTALLSFFEVDTPTMVVKMLDGRPINGNFWIGITAATNVAFTLTATDTATGAVKTYEQPQGTVVSPILDLGAFPSVVQLGASDSSVESTIAPGTVVCAPTTLCLHEGRFEVQVEWVAPFTSTERAASAIPFSESTGLFGFFDETNLELMVNIIDGRSANGHFWVYVASLTDVEWTMTVRDTGTGRIWRYKNPVSASAPVLDRQALPEIHSVISVPTLQETGLGALVMLLMASGLFVLRRG